MTAPTIPANSNSQLILSSPLAVLGLFVTILRERFSASANSAPTLAWEWRPSINDTGIYVESAWNENIEARGVRPGIWVDLGQTAYRQSGIGRKDKIPVVLPQNKEFYHSFVETDIEINCTAQKRGESLLIASTVQDFIMAASDIIEANFGLRHVSDSILNKPAPYKKDTVLWETSVNFRVYYEIRWITAPIDDILNKVSLRAEDAENTDFFVDIVT